MFGGGAPRRVPTLLKAAAQEAAVNNSPTNPRTRTSQNRRATSPPDFGRNTWGCKTTEKGATRVSQDGPPVSSGLSGPAGSVTSRAGRAERRWGRDLWGGPLPVPRPRPRRILYLPARAPHFQNR